MAVPPAAGSPECAQQRDIMSFSFSFIKGRKKSSSTQMNPFQGTFIVALNPPKPPEKNCSCIFIRPLVPVPARRRLSSLRYHFHGTRIVNIWAASSSLNPACPLPHTPTPHTPTLPPPCRNKEMEKRAFGRVEETCQKKFLIFSFHRVVLQFWSDSHWVITPLVHKSAFQS